MDIGSDSDIPGLCYFSGIARGSSNFINYVSKFGYIATGQFKCTSNPSY